MIYLKLFLTFLEIGAVSFGGGYGMIPLIRDAVMSNGWLSEDEFINFIAISESTPGPLAVNISTFIGSTQAGIAAWRCSSVIYHNSYYCCTYKQSSQIPRCPGFSVRNTSMCGCADSLHRSNARS